MVISKISNPLFSNDKRQLWSWKLAIIERLSQMRLTLHEREAQIIKTKDGIPWLGFVVYPKHRKLKRRNVVNFTRRLKHNLDLYERGNISLAELDASVQGGINHVRYADTWGDVNMYLMHIPLNIRITHNFKNRPR